MEEKQELAVTFELLTEEGASDPALVTAVGHEMASALQQGGYRILPADYSGRKGIESFLVELVTFVWANHTVIIADLGGLVAIFTALLPLFKRTKQAHEQQVGKAESATHPIKMTVTIDGASVVIEAPDLAQADAALHLALKYRAAHPQQAAQVTPESKVKVQARLPARQRHPRR